MSGASAEMEADPANFLGLVPGFVCPKNAGYILVEFISGEFGVNYFAGVP